MNTATDEAEEDMQASPWPIDIKRWEQKIYPHEAGRVFVCGEGAYRAEQSSLPGGVDRFAY
ncbi:MAG: hypothetical protein GX834_05680 [Clostridiaceae bacterium]|nr:hypothetical protein [Clostridiaceae bacterium]